MKKYLMVLIILLFMSLNVSCNEENFIVSNAPTYNETSKMLLIDLKGAIRLPNVYSVEEGTILNELINLAGGLEANADVSKINLAFVLSENQMITIPYKIENESNNNDSSGLININTASVNELCTLPGIGTSKANNIVNYRNSNGYFIAIEDIKKVSGIGEELFNKIKAYICV